MMIPIRKDIDKLNIPLLILIRHGECTGHANGMLFGQTDLPLDPKGMHQIQEKGHQLSPLIAKILQKNGVVRSCLTSDLKRCHKSAMILKKILEQNFITDVFPMPTANLRELHIGEWENKKIDDCIEDILFFIQMHKKNPDHARPPGKFAESAYMARQRIIPIIRKHLNHVENHSLHIQDILTDLEILHSFDDWLDEAMNHPINFHLHLWVVHEGSAHAILNLLNIDCWEPDMEAEFLRDEHQKFFKRGEILILRPNFAMHANQKNGKIIPIAPPWMIAHRMLV